MSIESVLQDKLREALRSFGVDAPADSIIIEHSKDKAHGDFATNVAMQMARSLHQAPHAIAEKIVARINMDGFDKTEIAGPGFINFFLKSETMSDIVKTIIDQGTHYGDSAFGNGKRVNVEFVSANPTGALHLGHARGILTFCPGCSAPKK